MHRARPRNTLRSRATLALLPCLLSCLLLGACAFQVGTRPLVSAQGVPLTSSSCKNGGWQTLRDNSGEPFKNQGDCVSFVNAGKGF